MDEIDTCDEPGTSAGNQHEWPDKDLAYAEQILQSRPGIRDTKLPSKGGAKLNEIRGTAVEERKLEEYYDTLYKSLSEWKVGKVGNLGVAEWLPDYNVAKVVKQGKFMQTKCHYHFKEFFALYAEEALFLLDVGEIQLTLNQLPLSMQDAYDLLLCETKHELLCTLDEYQVYAHLSRLGFRVQRYHQPNVKQKLPDVGKSGHKRQRSDVEEATTSKMLKNKHVTVEKPCSQNETIIGPTTKEIASDCDVLHTTELPFSKTGINLEQITTENDVGHKPLKHIIEEPSSDTKCRGWWPSSVENGKSKFTPLNHHSNSEYVPTKVEYIDFAKVQDEISTPSLNPQLIPSNCSFDSMVVEAIWSERISRDFRVAKSSALQPQDFSYSKDPYQFDMCRNASDWTEYREAVKRAELIIQNQTKDLCLKMYGGVVKPLVHPMNATSTGKVLEKLKSNSPITPVTSSEMLTKFEIKYNVFQTDKTKPFKKTQPGKPALRIVVCSTTDPMPTLSDYTSLENTSQGVSVKIALVDFGRILFFANESIKIPVDVQPG